MFRKITQFASKLTKNHLRKYTCWNPVEPVDPCTQITILHNGVKIATEEVESPLTCVTLTVAAGSRYETQCTNGLTHFIEHLAFKGFKTMDRCKLEDAIISMGARMTVRTSREKQVFSIILPSEYATTAVDKLFKIVSELEINESEIEDERYNICLELADSDINPKEVVFDYLHETAFQGTPLAQRVIGTSENISRFDATIVTNFVNEHYQPYRLILATSGKVTHEKIMQYSEARFGCLAPQPSCEPEPGPNRFTGSQVLFRDDSMPLCHVAIAFEAPGYLSSSYFTLLVMKHIVGRWDRSQGRTVENAPMVARDCAIADLCERYEAFYIPYRDVGLWGIYFVGDKWRLDEIVCNIQNQWMFLCTIVQPTDIERALNGVRLELAKRYDSVVNSSHDIGEQMLYTCSRRSLDELYATVMRTKVHNVREVADNMLYDRCPAVAVAGPSETLPDYLRIRSGQWWLRL